MDHAVAFGPLGVYILKGIDVVNPVLDRRGTPEDYIDRLVGWQVPDISLCIVKLSVDD